MAYVSIDEAAKIVELRTGVDITVAQIVRVAATAGFPVCILLNTRCYSPTVKWRNEAARRLAPGSSADRDLSGQSAVDAATVEAYGLFVLPARHVFDFQTEEVVHVSVVFSLDGKDSYCTSVKRCRNQIQVFLPHLEKLIDWIAAAKAKQVDIQPAEPSPAPASQVTQAATAKGEPVESKIDRQDRRLAACLAAGLKMPANDYEQLPAGVGELARLDGVTRQAFSQDVKAALKRQHAKVRAGVIRHSGG